MNQIAILTPTRGRPERMETFLRSVYDNASSASRVKNYFYVDSDDPSQISYAHLAEEINKRSKLKRNAIKAFRITK